MYYNFRYKTQSVTAPTFRNGNLDTHISAIPHVMVTFLSQITIELAAFIHLSELNNGMHHTGVLCQTRRFR